jgi:homocysteine S-methyltransferase
MMTTFTPGRLFLTDAGLETDMIFNRGLDLPLFSSSTLFAHEEGRAALEDYFRSFLDLARQNGTGCVLESATWRASPDWAAPLGLAPETLDRFASDAVALLRRLVTDYPDVETVVSGCIGPRGDGYDPGKVMSADEAEAYHSRQVRVMAAAGADLITAITMTNVPEAIGVARAAKAVDRPAVISFTVETDGRLPTGQELGEAIEAVDRATGAYPAYYMVNCAHPTHFANQLDAEAGWVRRIGGIRANASRCSHAELDAMTELDRGDPQELGRLYADLRSRLPWLSVLGGCCGTDVEHIAAIAEACIRAEAGAAA